MCVSSETGEAGADIFCSRAMSLFSSSVTEGDGLENASAVNVGQNLLAEWQNSDKKIRGTDKILEMPMEIVHRLSFRFPAC